ncbi:MAG: hypothetical protein AAF399_27720, partial [Bacteroidota bacterium]
MTTKELCDNIIVLYRETDPEGQNRVEILQLVYQLRREIHAESFTNASLLPILETAKEVATTKKKFKQILEKELLSFLVHLPHILWTKDDEGDNQRFTRDSNSREGQIAEPLIDFAKEIYAVKLDRDAFAGKRRGYALQILESLTSHFDVPEFMELCSKSIRS